MKPHFDRRQQYLDTLPKRTARFISTLPSNRWVRRHPFLFYRCELFTFTAATHAPLSRSNQFASSFFVAEKQY